MLPRFSRLLAILALAAGLAALGAPQLPVAAAAAAVGDCVPAADWPAGQAGFAAAVVQLVNEHRAGLGLGELSPSPALAGSAVWKARHMAMYQYMQHSDPAPPVDRTTGQRIAACGYAGGSWGENIAYGYPTPEAVFAAWLGSSGHRANIENPHFTAIGVGAAASSGGTVYWAQDFGVVAGQAPAAPPSGPPQEPTEPVSPAAPPAGSSPPPGPPVAQSPPTEEPAASDPPAEPDGDPQQASDQPPPVPGLLRIQTGRVRAGAVGSLAADDGRYLAVRSRAGRTAWYATVVFPDSPASIGVTYRGSSSASCRETVSIWSWSRKAWAALDSRRVATSEVEIRAAVPVPAGYVRSADGAVRIRVLCARDDRVPFTTRADLLAVAGEPL